MLDDLEQSDLLIESRQYRSPAGRQSLDLRKVADFAFVDLISLYILSHEYETAPVSASYAEKTMGFRNFRKPRLSGTDLYVSLNILTDPTGYFGKSIGQNPSADAILINKLRFNLPTVKRYLDLLQDHNLSRDDAATLMLRLEKQLNITDSKLKSMRRLAQDWTALDSMQKQLLVTRMLQFYKRNAKRSELAVFLEDMGKAKGYILKGGVDAELTNLGYQTAFGHALGAAAPVIGAMAGYKMGYALTGPKSKH
jgi:hypothetical protein